MKKFTVVTFLVLLFVLTVNCFADADPVVFSNGGLKLSVPAKYAEILTIETPENMLFSVSEKASIEAAKEMGYTYSGAGWLFGIGRVSEEQYHEMLCWDMNGVMVFAKDKDANYYMYYHPTDVRLIRKDYTYIDADMKAWGELNEWANSMRNVIIEENGLIPEKHGNTMLDIHLARMMYMNDLNYTVSTTQYGPMEPKGVIAADIIKPLFDGVTFKYAPDNEAPDGEYVVLNFPDVNVRYDFFLLDGKENIIREITGEGQYTTFYEAEFADKSLKASDIMLDLYNEMVLANSLGYTSDTLVGTWAEKIAGRGSIQIIKGDTAGKYNVMIHWSASAAEMYFWNMTAAATGRGAEIRYEDCTLEDIVFTEGGDGTSTVVYENGKGTFNLLSTYELIWDDETGHAADDTVFINAG